MKPRAACALAVCGVAMLVPTAAAAPPAVGGDPRVDPAEFRVTTFAAGLNFPTGMQQLGDGSVLVATSNPTAGGSFFSSTGALLRLRDGNGDGVADVQSDLTPVAGLPGTITTIRQAGDLLFATHATGSTPRISVMRRGATAADRYTLLGSVNFNFTADWWHVTYGQAVRPTPGEPGKYDLLFNIGSRDNVAPSTGNPTSTGMLAATYNPDSIYKVTVQDNGGVVSLSNLTQLATGLRNSVGMAFHPTTGDLYFSENGIDGLVDGNEPHSADELNTLPATTFGLAVPNYGFPNDYIQYRTGVRVGSGGVQPLVAFQPIPDPFTGSESEGPNEIAFAPASFPAGLNNGVFIGFHGKSNLAGLANEENPVVFYDLATGDYFHFISNDEPNIGHPDGLLATADSLFVADLANGSFFGPFGTGAIYQIQVIPEPAGMGLLALVGSGLLARRRKRQDPARR
jgi:glucose/arabinose dehydrogenase